MTIREVYEESKYITYTIAPPTLVIHVDIKIKHVLKVFLPKEVLMC